MLIIGAGLNMISFGMAPINGELTTGVAKELLKPGYIMNAAYLNGMSNLGFNLAAGVITTGAGYLAGKSYENAFRGNAHSSNETSCRGRVQQRSSTMNKYRAYAMRYRLGRRGSRR